MRSSILFAAALLLPTAYTSTAHAASFDCAKARTLIENHICADQKLSALDEELSKVYREVLDATPRPDAFRASQRVWLRDVRNVCTTSQCLTQAYQARLDDLIPSTRAANSGKSNNKAAVAIVTPTPEPVRSNPIVIDVAPAIKSPPPLEPNVVSAALPTPRATSTFSFKILDMSRHQRIAGKGGAVTRASEGRTLVVVRYSYKNLTTEPIGSMRLPSLALVSPDGARSQPDATASKAFVAATETKNALTNDRNPILTPGTTANDAGVFEVSTDALAKSGWSLVIEGDEDVKVPLALQN
jgi:uncharacterized protein